MTSSSQAAAYNLKIGAIRFSMNAGANVEYNDNINLAETGALSDLIFGAYLGVTGEWKLTQLNAFRMTLGVGRQMYLAHPQLDSKAFTITPDSQFSFDIFIAGKVKVTFYDRFQLIQDPTSQPTLSNVALFEQFTNDFGISALWDINLLILNAGYNHRFTTSLVETFSYTDSSADSLRLSLCHMISKLSSVGLDMSVATTYFVQKVQNDSVTFNLGPFYETTISNYLKGRISGGFQGMLFQTGGANMDNNSGLNGWCADLALAHRLNRRCSETLSIGHETALGLQSNFQTINYVRYSLSPQIFEKVSTDFNLFYETVAESGGVDAESLSRYGGGIQLGYKLTKKLQLGLGYQITTKVSNLPERNYLQNRVFLNANYQF